MRHYAVRCCKAKAGPRQLDLGRGAIATGRGLNGGLSFAAYFAHKQAMNGNNGTPDRSLRGLWKWATTPPQAYVVYVLALILVWSISFLAGTLNPKRTGGPSSPPAATQQR